MADDVRWQVVAPWPRGSSRSPRRRGLGGTPRGGSVRSRRAGLIACAVTLLVLAAYAVLVPLIAPGDPRVVDLTAYLNPPSVQHPFGTDLLGRDVFVRSAQALRVSLVIAALAAIASTVIGVVVGTAAAAMGGWFDGVVMRVVDAANALPHLLLGIVIAALWRGQWWAIVAAVGLTHWTQVARIVRSEVLQLRGSEYVSVAVSQGSRRIQVWLTHLVPAVLPQALIAVVLLSPHAIWHESALSFLGVGLPPNDPSLGTLLEDARSGILAGGWWLLVAPGGLLSAACLAVAGIGGYLRGRALPRRAVEAEVSR